MAKFEVPGSDGQFFTAHDTKGWPIVWLPSGVQLTLDFIAPAGHGADGRNVVGFDPNITVTVRHRTPHALRFTIKASDADTFQVQGQDAGGLMTNIAVVAGDFANHTDMSTDLLAQLCRAGNALNLLRVQQLLFNRKENIFNQKSDANVKKFGSMMCGAVAKGRATDLFGNVSGLDYTHPYHEPLGVARVSSRSEVKYRSDTITKVRNKIVGLLSKGMPVRVGVLDSPVDMMTHDHKLIAWESGGHTVVIVGCDTGGANFMYIDPWLNGSKLTYAGGIVGQFECRSMGIFTTKKESTRKVGNDPLTLPNLLVQSAATYGEFKAADESYLEVVAGPSI
jgi:hypothetical protein